MRSISPLENWFDPDAVVTVVPDGALPEVLHAVPLATPWHRAPTDDGGWAHVDGQCLDLEEPPLTPLPGLGVSAGVAIVESDGRNWLAHPTNQYAGYNATSPKAVAIPAWGCRPRPPRKAGRKPACMRELPGSWVISSARPRLCASISPTHRGLAGRHGVGNPGRQPGPALRPAGPAQRPAGLADDACAAGAFGAPELILWAIGHSGPFHPDFSARLVVEQRPVNNYSAAKKAVRGEGV